MDNAELALVEVGRWLRASGYEFVTPTPATHARVNARPGNEHAACARDLFGWSRPAPPGLVPSSLLAALRAADAIEERDGLWHPRVRFSTIDGAIYVHSAYPTTDSDAVFFGPDTLRFCALLSRLVTGARRAVDVGAGSGAGGLSLASRAERTVLADINPRALAFARVNAVLSGVANRVEVVASDVLASVAGSFDLLVSNPPYLVDGAARAYRHGGGELGTALTVRIVEEALQRLEPGGRLLVYSGAPLVAGVDVLRAAVAPLLDARGADWSYSELDPDVFGEELDRPGYATVDRIAVVAIVATVP